MAVAAAAAAAGDDAAATAAEAAVDVPLEATGRRCASQRKRRSLAGTEWPTPSPSSAEPILTSA